MEKGDLVCLCASHMNTVGRWERFMQMLKSWKEQTWQVPLMVSMSFEEGVKGEVRLPEMEDLTIIQQGRKMSQFEAEFIQIYRIGVPSMSVFYRIIRSPYYRRRP